MMDTKLQDMKSQDIKEQERAQSSRAHKIAGPELQSLYDILAAELC